MPMAVVVIMLVVMVVDGEELRLDVEDAVEVEGAPLQHFVDFDVAAIGAMQPRIGVDGADARLDFAQLGGETRSVLLTMMTSAKAIWFFASGASRSRWLSHLASATVTTASSRAAPRTSSSTKKV